MRFVVYIICILSATSLHAQKSSDELPQIKRYNQTEVYDSVNGIVLFNKLVEPLGGDSVLYNKSGYKLEGWHEVFYTNGNTLHKGYYVQGKLQVFKNYYQNGQLERSFDSSDPLNALLIIYYENGLPKFKTNYYSSVPYKQYEFYITGIPKYAYEKEKGSTLEILRKTWYESGQLESLIELTNKKEKVFLQRMYYSNGQLKEEGSLRLSSDSKSLHKEGFWTYFDESGKSKKTEKIKVQ